MRVKSFEGYSNDSARLGGIEMRKSLATRLRIVSRPFAKKLCERNTSAGRDAFKNILRGAISMENVSYLVNRELKGGK